eukprot:1957929-Lingulodinium_polyedra.AAC.1
MPGEQAEPPQPAAGQGPPAVALAQGIWIMMQCSVNEAYNVAFYHKVLSDSGANEIIRPYNHQWW